MKNGKVIPHNAVTSGHFLFHNHMCKNVVNEKATTFTKCFICEHEGQERAYIKCCSA